MKVRLFTIWDELSSSYWFMPALLAVGAVALSFFTLYVDGQVAAELAASVPWIWGGGPDGARGLLSTVAGSTITVAGVVFSITIVALSLASSQFGPRLLRQFMRSRTNQLGLGTYVATFIYSLLILRTIRTESGSAAAFVPHVSVTASLILVLISLGVLIYYIHHTAQAVQAPIVIADVAEDLLGAVKHIFPDGLGREPPPGVAASRDQLPPGFEAESEPVAAKADGYLQAIDNDTLMRVAGELDVVLHVLRRPGHFCVRDNPLVCVFPGQRLTAEAAERLQKAFIVGRYRTGAQDVEFAVDQLVEVAVRALSPGINDPFTAIACIDWLSAALRRLAGEPFPSPYRYDADGRLRIVVESPETFGDMVDAAFNLIRQNAEDDAAVQIRLLEAITAIAANDACTEESRTALLNQARMIQHAAQAKLEEGQDVDDVRERFRNVQEMLDAA